MKSGPMTPQEMAGLHDVLVCKMTGAVKMNVYKALVKDQRLQRIVDQSISASKLQLGEIKNLLTSSGAVG